MEWTEQEKAFVWSRAEQVFGVDAAKFRKDVCGAWIGWEYYGDRNSPYGWEMDHISPYLFTEPTKGGLTRMIE